MEEVGTVSPWENGIVNRMGGLILRELARPDGAREVSAIAAAVGIPTELARNIIVLLKEDGLVAF